MNTAFPPSRACTRKNDHNENGLLLAARIVKRRISSKFMKAKHPKTLTNIRGLGILKHISLRVNDGAVRLNGAYELEAYEMDYRGCCNSPTLFTDS